MANGYLNTYQEEPLRNRSNHLLTDWVHPIAPSSEHSVQSSTSSIKSRPGGLSLEARQRTVSTDSVPKARKGKAVETQADIQPTKPIMSSYTNGDKIGQPVAVPPYHQDYPPPHLQYPPHLYHHVPQPHPTTSYLPRHAELAQYHGTPASMFGPPLQPQMSNGHSSNGHPPPHEVSHGRPSSRKSAKKVDSPAMTYTALERKLSTATSATHESSNGRTTPPGPSSQSRPQSQRSAGPSASAKKQNGSVPKKRGRPPKIKQPSLEASSSVIPTIVETSSEVAPRKAKRQRIAPPPIPTPPSTSIAHPTSNETEADFTPMIIDEDTEAERRRKTLAIMTHQTDGRRLDCNSDYVDRPEYTSARHRAPGLVVDDRGSASFDAGEAISQELAWMNNKSLPSPPLSADAPLPPPYYGMGPIPDTEIHASPLTQAMNLEKRMERFRSQINRPQAAETKFAEGGRIITPGPGLTDLLMNPHYPQHHQKRPRLDDAGSIVQPDWPEIPGSVAWPHQDPIQEGNRRRELASIENYLTLSESEEEDERPDRFRISIRNTAIGHATRRAVPDKFTLIDGAPSDALTALKLTMRNRDINKARVCSMACDCRVDFDVEQPLLTCINCRDLHHAACYPAREVPQNPWEPFFCRACRERVLRHATPVQTPRAYAQSDLRSSAFKGDMAFGEMAGIALMPSPIFPVTTRTPYGQLAGGRAQSPRGPVQARTLSYADDPFFKYFEVPTTPAPAGGPRTPRDGGGSGFDVMSTPSRHLDYSTLVRYPRPSDSHNRSMMSDTMAFSTPLSSRMPSSGGSSIRPMMMSSKSTITPHASSSSSLTAGPSNSSATTGPSTGPNTGVGSPDNTQRHQLLGGALIMSPTGRQRQVSKNNLSSLHVDASGDLMGPMIDAADFHDDDEP